MAVSVPSRSQVSLRATNHFRPNSEGKKTSRRAAGTIAGLALSLLLAISATELRTEGRDGLSVLFAALALCAACVVALKAVPHLVRKALRERWTLEYEFTREGAIYLLMTALIAIAAVNTGNNLLFMILAILLAGMLVSGVLSKAVLGGLSLDLALPEHVFAGEPVRAAMTIQNTKRIIPSFSLTVTASRRKIKKALGAGGSSAVLDRSILTAPVYAPFVPARGLVREEVELRFSRRGRYEDDGFEVSSKFPFSILRRKRIIASKRQILVLPPVQAASEVTATLPTARGDIDSLHKGQGADLYGLRNYQAGDPAKHVDWKATAKTQKLMVRQFTREDDRRLAIFFDPVVEELSGSARARFERAVELCARLAWQASEEGSLLQFTGGTLCTALAPASETVYPVLEELAVIEPTPSGGPKSKIAPEPLPPLLSSSADNLVIFTLRPEAFSAIPVHARVINPA